MHFFPDGISARYTLPVRLCLGATGFLALLQPMAGVALTPSGVVFLKLERTLSSYPLVSSPAILRSDKEAVVFSKFVEGDSLPTEPGGLKSIVRQALDRHPSIASAIAALMQEESGIDFAKAGYKPQFRLGLGSGTSNGLESNGMSSQATASVSQMLYDFGKVAANVDQASARVVRQRGQIFKQVDEIAQKAADTVVMLHRYQILEKLANEQVRAVMKVYELARLRGEGGLSSQSDPIQAWARVEAARASFLQTRSLRQQWHERLRTLLGPNVPMQVAALPADLLDAVPVDAPLDMDSIPEVMMAKAELQLAGAQVESAKAQRWPTLTLDASVNKRIGGGTQATTRPDGLSHNIGVNLSSPLFQGNALNAQIRGALAAEEAARKRMETAFLEADDQVRSFREQLNGARERIQVLSDRRKSINEVRDLYREQYTLGTRSILDLLNAEQEIFQAAQDEENVRHDLWQAWVGMVAATGLSRDIYGISGAMVQGMVVSP